MSMARRGENIYKRKDGRWEGRYIKGYDIAGKAQWKYIYGRNYAEVKERLTYLKSTVKNNKDIVSSNMTLEKWLDIWLSQKGQIKESTAMMYKSCVRNHIVPVLGAVKLKELNKEMLQKLVDDMSDEFKPSTVRSAYALLRLALETAEEQNMVSGFFRQVKLPKMSAHTVKALTVTEQKSLEKVVSESGKPNDIGVLICLYTGIRIGELCALKWENIDLKKGVMHIRETIQRVENTDGDKKTKIHFSTPKSSSSQREIPMPRFLIEKLSAVKKEKGFVINRYGKFVEPRTYARRFKKLIKLAGIKDVNFHCTRHTFSTRALEIGVDIKTLSEILGHASASITMNLYAHSLSEHKKKEMERLGKLFNYPSE